MTVYFKSCDVYVAASTWKYPLVIVSQCRTSYSQYVKNSLKIFKRVEDSPISRILSGIFTMYIWVHFLNKLGYTFLRIHYNDICLWSCIHNISTLEQTEISTDKGVRKKFWIKRNSHK